MSDQSGSSGSSDTGSKSVQQQIENHAEKLEAKFMSRDDHLYQRGLSKINTRLQTYVPSSDSIQLRAKDSAGPHQDLYKYVQETLLNMLIREHEVGALALSGQQEGFHDHLKQHFTLLVEPRLTLAINPRKDDQQRLGRGENDDLPAALKELTAFAMDVRKATPPTNGLQQAPNVISFVLSQLEACRAFKSKDYLFSEHVSYFLVLLRACHSASDKSGLSLAVDRLTKYIFITSYGKMVRRLKYGKGERRLYDIITADVHEQRLDSHLRPVARGLQRPPTPQQAESLRPVLRELEGATDAGVEKILAGPLYDEEGRYRFHYLLRLRVIKVNNALTLLDKTMSEFKTLKTADKSACQPPTHAEIEKRVDRASRAVRKLTLLQHRFKEVMLPHLEWLADLAGVDDEGKSPQWARNEGTSSPLPGTPQQPALSQTSTAVRTASKPSASEEEAADPEKDEFDDEDEEFNLIASKDYPTESTRFAAVSNKFLQLICLLDHCLIRATTFNASNKRPLEEHQSKLILRAEVSVAEVRYGRADQEVKSLTDCLNRLKAREPELTGESKLDIQLLTAWFRKQNTKVDEHGQNVKDKDGNDIEIEKSLLTKTNGFTGSIHCESMLMAFWSAIRDPELLNFITEGWIVSNERCAIEADLLKMFENWLPLMHVSKRCCPPCWSLLQLMESEETFKGHSIKDGKLQVGAPGNHPVWTALALPSWMPKQQAEQVLAFHEKESIKMLLKIQDDEEQVNRILSDPTNHDSPLSDQMDKVAEPDEDDESDDDDASSLAATGESASRLLTPTSGKARSQGLGSSPAGPRSSPLDAQRFREFNPDAKTHQAWSSPLPERPARFGSPDPSTASRYLEVPTPGSGKHRRGEHQTDETNNEEETKARLQGDGKKRQF